MLSGRSYFVLEPELASLEDLDSLKYCNDSIDEFCAKEKVVDKNHLFMITQTGVTNTLQ